MLENMPQKQFLEWMEYLRIKSELENPKGTPGSKTAPTSGADPNVGLRLLGAFSGFQKRRDKLKAGGRIH